jgi:hypothetical protein
MLTLQSLKKTRRSIYSLRHSNFARIINLHMDRRLRKLVRNQCMNRNIHWRPTMESLQWANCGSPLRNRFRHCLCEERKNRSNGKSRELHLVNLISEMGLFRCRFYSFFTKLLIPRLNPSLEFSHSRVYLSLTWTWRQRWVPVSARSGRLMVWRTTVNSLITHSSDNP